MAQGRKILKQVEPKFKVSKPVRVKKGPSGGISLYWQGRQYPVTVYADEMRGIAEAMPGILANLETLGIADKAERTQKEADTQDGSVAL